MQRELNELVARRFGAWVVNLQHRCGWHRCGAAPAEASAVLYGSPRPESHGVTRSLIRS